MSVLADRPPATDPWEAAARQFEPAGARFAGPLDLLTTVDPLMVRTPGLELISRELVARYEAARWEETPDFLAVSMGPQEGKALALDTPIATPGGWTTMGDLRPGDQVFGGDGRPCRVVAVSPVWTGRPCFEVITGQGERIVADAAHEWVVRARPSRPREQVATTADLAAPRYKAWQVIGPGGIDLPEADLPMDPYVLGAWLGDGHTRSPRMTTADPEIIDRIRAAGYPASRATGTKYGWTMAGDRSDAGPGRRSQFRRHLDAAGVFGRKHIPTAYLRGSREQRLALLQGLIDTDGYVAPKGQVEFVSTLPGMAEDVQHLVHSLGGKASVAAERARLNGRDVGPRWRVKFYLADAAHLPRKASRCKDSSVGRISYVRARPVESVPTVCIQVDSPDRTFLAGRTLLRTHNSTLISFAWPLWLLMQNPDLRIMLISYEQHQALGWGMQVRDAILGNSGQEDGLDLGLRLRPGSTAKDRWFLAGRRGGMVCLGLDGAITGKPADVVILDDLVKDRKVAQSAAFKRTWLLKWGTAIRPRLGPKSAVVLAHTRWAEDDPIGQQLAEHGDRWRYCNIPAQAGERDPLGRAPGEWLVSARGRTPAQWEQARADVGPHDFAALWQGEPMPAAGGLFKRAHLRYWTATSDPWTVRLPGGREENVRHGWRFATVDLAASTRSSADWTVAGVWSITPTGELLLLDLARARVDPEEHWDLVRGLVERWHAKLFVEASQFGTDLVYTAGREGAALEKLEADTDKYTRAVPAARRIRQGTVFFPAAASWLPDLVDELLVFPGGAHDDQVDVVAYASRVMSEVWWPGLLAPPADLETPRARRAEVGLAGTDAFDPMGVEF